MNTLDWASVDVWTAAYTTARGVSVRADSVVYVHAAGTNEEMDALHRFLLRDLNSEPVYKFVHIEHTHGQLYWNARLTPVKNTFTMTTDAFLRRVPLRGPLDAPVHDKSEGLDNCVRARIVRENTGEHMVRVTTSDIVFDVPGYHVKQGLFLGYLRPRSRVDWTLYCRQQANAPSDLAIFPAIETVTSVCSVPHASNVQQYISDTGVLSDNSSGSCPIVDLPLLRELCAVCHRKDDVAPGTLCVAVQCPYLIRDVQIIVRALRTRFSLRTPLALEDVARQAEREGQARPFF